MAKLTTLKEHKKNLIYSYKLFLVMLFLSIYLHLEQGQTLKQMPEDFFKPFIYTPGNSNEFCMKTDVCG